MYLNGTDFRSNWTLALLWKGYSPESIGNEALPEEVQDLIQRIIAGHFRGDLHLRKKVDFSELCQ